MTPPESYNKQQDKPVVEEKNEQRILHIPRNRVHCFIV